ncbi:MAG: NAD(+) kinase [Candidatus Dasytiphilus stammeri]
MKKKFNNIGLVGRPRNPNALITLKTILEWLKFKGYEVYIEYNLAHKFNIHNIKKDSLTNIGKQADLAVVIGGDGNMLRAARVLAKYNINVIGINSGNLGFLTDLTLRNAQYYLNEVLKGHYIIDNRFLLEATIGCYPNYPKNHYYLAMNEVIIHTGKVAHMFEFEVYIDDQFAFSQRSDGLIISTPTGSTAYSLSAGGTILTPSLDAIILVSMFPHTLSSRPLVINSSSIILIRLRFSDMHLYMSCDSQIMLSLNIGEDIVIRRSIYNLNLIHPINYNYFNILSNKLGWSKKLF